MQKKKSITNEKQWCGIEGCQHIDSVRLTNFSATVIEICKESKAFIEIDCTIKR